MAFQALRLQMIGLPFSIPTYAPSLLAAKGDLLKGAGSALKAGFKILHFDVMDGRFVPNTSFSHEDFLRIKEAFPEAFIDVHLMVKEPLEEAKWHAEHGASVVTVHLEAFENRGDLRKTASAIRSGGALAGLSIKPLTPVPEAFPYLEDFDLLLLMSVEPGRGGQAFLPESPERMKALSRKRHEEGLDDSLLLEIDGGVNDRTSGECVSSGADILVVGSYLFSDSAVDEKAAERLFGWTSRS